MAPLDYQFSDGIATIRLDDGAAIVLTGRPGMFSAGFDLATINEGGEATRAMVIGGFRLAERILTYRRPVVVGCTGHAIAMGTFLVLTGDYRIGPEDGSYKWMANEVAIGLVMPRTAIELLRVRLTPGAVDKAVALSHQFGPSDALASGYFDELVPLDDVVERSTAVARAALTTLDARAHAASKERTRAPAIAAIARAIQEDDDDFDRWMAASGR